MAEAGTERDLFGHTATVRPGVAQLPLPLAWSAADAMVAGTLLIDESNATAVRHIEQVGQWPTPVAILVGPAKSGKTLLGTMFVARSGGAVIDELSDTSETAVFHAWNRAISSGTPLLILASSHEAIAEVQLPDLATRLAAAPVVTIGPPEPALCAALIERRLAGRGLAATPQIADYAAQRIERSYAAVDAIVGAIDAHAMARGRDVGIGMVREILRAQIGAADATGDDVADNVVESGLAFARCAGEPQG